MKVTNVYPLKYDAFYVSLLSEKYKTGKKNYFKAFKIGLQSNLKAMKTKEYSSSAAVYMLMDRSGSMTSERKDIAKTFYFWMVQFLKRKYKKIDLVFIAHDVKAYEVSEKDFFE